MTFYVIPNYETNQTDYVETEELANAKLIENRNFFMTREEYRFSMAKEVVEGNNTTWCAVDLENDSEEGMYQVFNHNTGTYEPINGLSNAKLRIEELKQAFIKEYKLDVWTTVDAIPTPSGVYPESTFGTTVGVIPVEVM